MSKRIALTTVILLLLLQAVPVLACVAMPGEALGTCCCETDPTCAMANRSGECAVPGACCVRVSNSTPALGVAGLHDDEGPAVLAIANGILPAQDPLTLLKRQASLDAATLRHYSSAPLPTVPLYLRHLRLTL
ncbi:MAG: hypothetical protein WDO56_14840 [Gammaproteobacteria bacterium]